MPERYGQKSIGSYHQQDTADEDYPQQLPQFNSQTIQQQPEQPQYQFQEIQPTMPTHKFYRQREPTRTLPVQTNFVTPYATSVPKTSSVRPEFISLLSDDDEAAYFNNPQTSASRFRHQSRPLLASAQEVYPSYAAGPQYQQAESSSLGMGQYVKSLRPRNSFMYSPYNYEGF